MMWSKQWLSRLAVDQVRDCARTNRLLNTLFAILLYAASTLACIIPAVSVTLFNTKGLGLYVYAVVNKRTVWPCSHDNFGHVLLTLYALAVQCQNCPRYKEIYYYTASLTNYLFRNSPASNSLMTFMSKSCLTVLCSVNQWIANRTKKITMQRLRTSPVRTMYSFSTVMINSYQVSWLGKNVLRLYICRTR